MQQKRRDQLYFSSASAAAKYESNPRDFMLGPTDEATLAVLGEAAYSGYPDYRFPNTNGTLACPFSGGGLNISMQTPRVFHKYGQAVYFCCYGCVVSFYLDPKSSFNKSAATMAWARLN